MHQQPGTPRKSNHFVRLLGVPDAAKSPQSVPRIEEILRHRKKLERVEHIASANSSPKKRVGQLRFQPAATIGPSSQRLNLENGCAEGGLLVIDDRPAIGR
jgi:hypothetical protein